MEGLYYFIGIVLLVGQWVLPKIIDVGEEEMRDTPVYRWFLLGSWTLLTPILILIWTMDKSRPYPVWPLLFAVLFCFRGYMEWKYLRDTMRHKVSFILAGILILFALLMVSILILKY